ncbi:hypothetical protein IAR63_13260 [Cylindrospermopsis curvispora GIHE-G1]|uniref:Peptidase M15A C-terminal domain-containing protein n=2 Tax=Aphanizomenonaceae TaxID=1892259 RepID=A0A7H0EYH0_9CYAN|nr:hypothetical protein IAR63_13260 [Cylindrospermopsis curvispora GIHE-G1]
MSPNCILVNSLPIMQIYREIATKLTIKLIHAWRLSVGIPLTWEPVREKFGSPIRITSGYRPPAVNSSLGGARNSQHLYFRA